MTSQPTGAERSTGPATHATHDRAPAQPGAVFAGVIMAISGVLGILQGASAIAKNAPYANGLHYAYRFDVTAWGWIHLLFGVALMAVGLCLLSGMAWAKWAGVIFAGTTMALQFMFLPFYPAWALIAITLDVIVLWALLLHASEPVR